MHARSAFLVPPGPWNTTTAYYSVVLVLVLVVAILILGLLARVLVYLVPLFFVEGCMRIIQFQISAPQVVTFVNFCVCVRLLRKAEGSTLILKSYSMILLSTYRFGNRCRSKGNMDWWHAAW